MKTIGQYIYTIYAVIIFVLTFLIQLPFFVLFALFGNRGTKALNILLKIWSRLFFFLILITIRVYGKEKIDRTKKYIVVANHYSFLDTPMIFATVPFMVKPLARSDFGKIPLFGFIYRTMTIPVNRSNNQSKKASYEKMLKTVKDEPSQVFIFPEGSFNETDKVLKGFFNGAFNLAKDTNTEILPVLFPDTIKRWHYSSFWAWSPGVSRAYFLDPIEISTINALSTEELKNHVHGIMENHMTILKST